MTIQALQRAETGGAHGSSHFLAINGGLPLLERLAPAKPQLLPGRKSCPGHFKGDAWRGAGERRSSAQPSSGALYLTLHCGLSPERALAGTATGVRAEQISGASRPCLFLTAGAGKSNHCCCTAGSLLERWGPEWPSGWERKPREPS